ncbi:hypothetical protein FRC17_008824 [Serendipita sp. 399]|nr:hypothetical protein FRC17_008824 [Serendipita sp. 399]
MRESSRPTNIPRISHTSIAPEVHRRVDKGHPADLPVSTKAADTDDWKSTMANENTRKVEEMSEDQREKERAELISHFGPGIVDLVQKVAERRKLEEGQPSLSGHERPKSAMAHSRSTTTESSPSNKPLRKLRFSENPDKVYVYESEPSSPKRVLALPPPPTDRDPNEDVPVISLENWQKGSPKKKKQSTRRLDDNNDDGEKPGGESTPETIREKYFPEEPHPSQNPTLAWLIPGAAASTVKTTQAPSSAASSLPLTVRYDLQGRVIPHHLKQTLPSHLGLHHHGDSPDDAGYTLDELLLLSRSTLPAQRAAMLLVLGRIIRRLRDGRCSELETPHMKEIFQKSLIVGIEAFGDPRDIAHLLPVGRDLVQFHEKLAQFDPPDLYIRIVERAGSCVTKGGIADLPSRRPPQ